MNISYKYRQYLQEAKDTETQMLFLNECKEYVDHNLFKLSEDIKKDILLILGGESLLKKKYSFSRDKSLIKALFDVMMNLIESDTPYSINKNSKIG